ncbi:glycosyltransferase [Micromonospora sp. SH-82]|uniref:glycosyltransferase n=1 Tax=Micromonospora sp. SH-82 TaxID=3132938 RepID=UPI003EBE08F6
MTDPGDATRFHQAALEYEADVLFGTHALLSGRLFCGSPVPYVLAFGGTDLNDHVHDQETLDVMAEAATGAAALVAFTQDFMARCGRLWPQVLDRLHHIPQGVWTDPARHFSLRHLLGLSSQDRILLLPSGLRPVKDPLLLVDAVQRWHREDARVHLVIVGHSYDPSFERVVRRRCAVALGVHYVGALSPRQVHAAMAEATMVLNTSLGECSPNALLEAMSLGAAVLVRDIPGNTCVVRHEETGLVFTDPDDFLRQARRLCDDEALRLRLGGAARVQVEARHGMAGERDAYGAILADLARRASSSAGDRVSLPGAVVVPAVNLAGTPDRVATGAAR